MVADFLPLPFKGFFSFFLSTGLELLWAIAALAVLFTTLVVEGLVFEDRVAAFALALARTLAVMAAGSWKPRLANLVSQVAFVLDIITCFACSKLDMQ